MTRNSDGGGSSRDNPHLGMDEITALFLKGDSKTLEDYDRRKLEARKADKEKRKAQDLEHGLKAVESNVQSREFKIKSLFAGVFGELGIFSALELDESCDLESRKERLEIMLELLNLADPVLVQNELQRNVKILNPATGIEVREKDHILKNMIEIIAGETMSSTDKITAYSALYYLIHQVIFDKIYSHESGRETTVSDSILVKGHSGNPRYFNALAVDEEDRVVVTTDQKALSAEIANNLASAVSAEKTRLMAKFIELGGSEEEVESKRVLGSRISNEQIGEIAEIAHKKHSSEKEVGKLLKSQMSEVPSSRPASAGGESLFSKVSKLFHRGGR